MNFNIMMIILVMGMGCLGQSTIVDVPVSDPSYPAIQRTLEKGYFTIMDGGQFLPNQAVSRKELALMLDRMDALAEKAALSPNDIIELKSFSSTFSSYLESQQNTKQLMGEDVGQIKTEQKTIHYDMSRLEDHVDMVEKKQKEQEVWMWAAIGLGVLGLLQ